MGIPLGNETSLILTKSRLRRLQLLFTGFCAMSIGLNNLDRATISVAAVNVRHDFGLTATEIGALISVWSLSYAFAQLPAGFLVDRFGPRLLAGIGMLLWSIFQGLGGIVTSYGQLLWLRGALGIAEAPTGPSNAKVVATWFPESKRGVPTGLYVSGTALGPAIAPPLLTSLMLIYGWRMMFIIMGIVGVILSTCWLLFYRNIQAAGVSRKELVSVGFDEHASGVTITIRQWGGLFRTSTVLGIIFGCCALGFVTWIYSGWLPMMLETQYHETIRKTGYLAAIPWIGGVVGALLGGYIADFLVKIGFGRVNSKKIPIVCGVLGLSVFTALAGLSRSLTIVETFVFFGLMAASISVTVLWTSTATLVPKEYVASFGSIMNFSSFIGATISPILTGYTVDVTGSFDVALLIGSGVGILGAVIMAIMIKKPVSVTDLISPAGFQTRQTSP